MIAARARPRPMSQPPSRPASPPTDPIALLEASWPDGYRFALRYTGDPASAEDLVQSAWVAALRHLDPAAPPREPRAWFFRVLINIAHNERRGARRRRLRERRAARPEVVASTVSDAEAWLREALAELEPTIRTALVLKYLHEMTLAEVAAATDAPLGTAASRVRRGLETLRERAGRTGLAPTALGAVLSARSGDRLPVPAIPSIADPTSSAPAPVDRAPRVPRAPVAAVVAGLVALVGFGVAARVDGPEPPVIADAGAARRGGGAADEDRSAAPELPPAPGEAASERDDGVGRTDAEPTDAAATTETAAAVAGADVSPWAERFVGRISTRYVPLEQTDARSAAVTAFLESQVTINYRGEEIGELTAFLEDITGFTIFVVGPHPSPGMGEVFLSDVPVAKVLEVARDSTGFRAALNPAQPDSIVLTSRATLDELRELALVVARARDPEAIVEVDHRTLRLRVTAEALADVDAALALLDDRVPVTGRVVSLEDDTAIAGATVRAESLGPNGRPVGTARTTTDGDGRFEDVVATRRVAATARALLDDAALRARLIAEGPRTASIRVEALADGRDPVVRQTGAPTDLIIGLRRGGRELRYRVVDRTGAPIEGIRVRVQRGARETATTDADGRVRFTGLGPDATTVWFADDRGRFFQSAEKLAPSDPPSERTITLARAVTLTVKVTDAGSPSEPPRGHILLTPPAGDPLIPSSLSSFDLRAVGDGTLRFDVPAGTGYRLDVAIERDGAPRASRRIRAGLADRSLSLDLADDEIVEVEVDATSAGAIEGRVRPLAEGESIRVGVRAPDARSWNGVWVDREGCFTIAGVPPGRWLVGVSSASPPALDRTIDPEHLIEVEIAAGETVAVDLADPFLDELGEPAPIAEPIETRPVTITVTDHAGRPVAGARGRVDLRVALGGSMTSDADGAMLLPALPRTTVGVRLAAPGAAPVWVTIPPDMDAIAVTVRRAARLVLEVETGPGEETGRIFARLDPGGDALDGLRPASAATSLDERTPAGRIVPLVIEDAPAGGVVTVVVAAGGRARLRERVLVPEAGGTIRLRLEPATDGTAVTVRMPDGEPVFDAYVLAHAPSPGGELDALIAIGRTDGAGRATLSALEPGELVSVQVQRWDGVRARTFRGTATAGRAGAPLAIELLELGR